jgi:AraC-like DNA-binding protein
VKILQTEIAPFVNNPLHLELSEHPYVSSLNNGQAFFHEHPELQLTFILEGYGKRIIGNQIAPFESMDMVFIGSHVPHVWQSDPVFYEKGSSLQSKVITVYIDPRIFQQMFDSLKEMDAIRGMIQEASMGISIFGETRNKIAEKLISLCSQTGFERLDGLLQIMNLISISSEKSLIIKKEIKQTSGNNSDRLVNVLNYMKEHLQEQISLQQIANVAFMTVPAFCRFFKNRTKKTFSEYLIELRIDDACKMLIEADKPISEIAHSCGFVSHSHFCKVFRTSMKQSPIQYKCNFISKAV